MVTVHEEKHTFPNCFHDVSVAYLNRYPNPYAKHVVSVDTIEQEVDDKNCLRTTRLIMKTGKVPSFVKPIIGNHLNSWIIEKLVVDPKKRILMSYCSNLDHRHVIKVEQLLKYTGLSGGSTEQRTQVRISSNLIGFRRQIEEWSYNRITGNLTNSRLGLLFALKERRFGKLQSLA